MQVPPFFQTGVLILLGAAAIHFLFVAIFGRLPRFMGLVLIIAYAVFLKMGLGK
jgi:cation:H+ antiporter